VTTPIVVPAGHWIVASQREGRPVAGGLADLYPCRCEDIDTDPPIWKRERAARTGDPTVFICDPYVSKKGHNVGRWTNRCPCWGGRRDHAREGCCAHHEGNPRYLPVGPDGRPLAAPLLAEMLHDTIPPSRDAGWQAPHERIERPIHDVAPAAAYAEALGIPYEAEPEPYVRRWKHAELHCDCPTPWDHMTSRDSDGKLKVARGHGHHCSADGCHTNWRSYAASVVHCRDVTKPCTPPQSIVDCETGEPLLRARMDGPYLIWG
jgi:hypothetical protein